MQMSLTRYISESCLIILNSSREPPLLQQVGIDLLFQIMPKFQFLLDKGEITFIVTKIEKVMVFKFLTCCHFGFYDYNGC